MYTYTFIVSIVCVCVCVLLNMYVLMLNMYSLLNAIFHLCMVRIKNAFAKKLNIRNVRKY